MSLRLIEIVAPREEKQRVADALDEQRKPGEYVYWATPLDDENLVSFRIVLEVQDSGDVLDRLEEILAWEQQYRIVVHPVEATIPRLSDKSKGKDEDGDGESDKEEKRSGSRVSREELYAEIADSSKLSKSFLVMTALATLVAVIGLMRDSVAIIIGAMVLAPLLGPNVGMCLATTLGDRELGKSAAKTLLAGVALAFGVALVAGWLVPMDSMTQEMLMRSETVYSDVILAVVSGAAGIVAFTLGAPTSLVGVMVALSLLPPLTACGLFLGVSNQTAAGGAALLFITNVICLNLAGMVTFMVQGVRPHTWWQQERAKRATRRVVVIWAVLLAVLLGVIYLQSMR